MLRRELRWAFGLTLALTAAALLTLDEPGADGEAATSTGWPAQPGAAPGAAPSATPGTPSTTSAAVSTAPLPLPRQLDRQSFASPDRDLFATPQPIVAPTKAPAPAPPPPPPVVTAPPPPPVTARFVAQLLTPQGERVLYLREGEQIILAKPGVVLNGGYVIEALLDSQTQQATSGASTPPPAAKPATDSPLTAVQLVHQASGHRELLRLPPPQVP